MFSQTSGYALRITAYLGAHPEGPVKNAEISRATDVPVEYLYKILDTLRRNGLVVTRRGLHGGYILSRPAETISIYDIVQAVEPSLGSRCKASAGNWNWSPAQEGIEQVISEIVELLKRSTLSDLLRCPLASPVVPIGQGA